MQDVPAPGRARRRRSPDGFGGGIRSGPGAGGSSLSTTAFMPPDVGAAKLWLSRRRGLAVSG